jgi:hypothetical protein
MGYAPLGALPARDEDGADFAVAQRGLAGGRRLCAPRWGMVEHFCGRGAFGGRGGRRGSRGRGGWKQRPHFGDERKVERCDLREKALPLRGVQRVPKAEQLLLAVLR